MSKGPDASQMIGINLHFLTCTLCPSLDTRYSFHTCKYVEAFRDLPCWDAYYHTDKQCLFWATWIQGTPALSQDSDPQFYSSAVPTTWQQIITVKVHPILLKFQGLLQHFGYGSPDFSFLIMAISNIQELQPIIQQQSMYKSTVIPQTYNRDVSHFMQYLQKNWRRIITSSMKEAD